MSFSDVLNIISLIASGIGSLILLSLAYRRPKLMKRVSLQLQTGIALLDITRHIQIFTSFSGDDGLCTFTSFYGFFSDHLYVFLNVAIALNLHLFLLERYKPRHYVIWVYFTVSTVVSFAINVVPLGLGYFGKSDMGGCYLKSNVANPELVKLVLVHIINWPGIIYCLIVSLIVMSQYIFGKIEDIETDIIWLPEVRGLSFMISLNSFACFLTMFPYLLGEVLFDWFGFESPVLYSLTSIALNSTGTLNLLCLLLDFHVWNAIHECSSQRELLPSNYELAKKTNNYVKPDAFESCRNTILSPLEPNEINITERETLINFL